MARMAGGAGNQHVVLGAYRPVAWLHLGRKRIKGTIRSSLRDLTKMAASLRQEVWNYGHIPAPSFWARNHLALNLDGAVDAFTAKGQGLVASAWAALEWRPSAKVDSGLSPDRWVDLMSREKR